MSLQETVSAERLHIGFFGVCNVGKSSLVNSVTGQELAVVAAARGTTTDPVRKAMELLPIGPVVIIDTPGLDDESDLGELRIRKTKQVLAKTDLAVLVIDANRGIQPADKALITLLLEQECPYVLAYNKADLLAERPPLPENAIYVSAATGEAVGELKERLGALAAKSGQSQRHIVSDLLTPGDVVVLVVPIDEAAPKGRLILPQQQTIREILDAHCSVVVCQDTELKQTLASLSLKPKLVITDSQAFERVARDTPPDIGLTSFSILFARYKGDLETLIQGAARLSQLREGDKVLISEGCTHHRQCGDIGTVKLPKWIEAFTGAKPEYHFTSGGDFPEDLSGYALVIHCGGCMLNRKEMEHRISRAAAFGVPVVNYGAAIARMNGILKRSLEPLSITLDL